MEPHESSFPAQRRLGLHDYAGILRHHKGWIFGPVFFGLVISVAAAFLWPDTYVSVATSRVAPPEVPENFVPANTNRDIRGRVNALLRATLTNIIHAHGLYKRKLARLPMDDVIEGMKSNDIQVLPMRQNLNPAQSRDAQQYPAFEIRFA